MLIDTPIVAGHFYEVLLLSLPSPNKLLGLNTGDGIG